MTEQEVISKLNEFIAEENGEEITIDSFLLDSDLDSFSYALFWFKVCEEYPHIDNDYWKTIDYVTYEVRELVGKILDEH